MPFSTLTNQNFCFIPVIPIAHEFLRHHKPPPSKNFRIAFVLAMHFNPTMVRLQKKEESADGASTSVPPTPSALSLRN
jgi:hypothetical protein